MDRSALDYTHTHTWVQSETPSDLEETQTAIPGSNLSSWLGIRTINLAVTGPPFLTLTLPAALILSPIISLVSCEMSNYVFRISKSKTKFLSETLIVIF